MHALEAYGVQELDATSEERLTGGAIVPLGIAFSGAFVAGARWGYGVLGPWLEGEI